MQRYEFRVIPAPRRGEKARGVKTTEERFALALTNLMNSMGAEGWDYVRADTLPVDERSGLTGTKTSYQNLLVFRRPLPAALAQAPFPRPAEPTLVEPPLTAPAPAPAPAPAAPPAPAAATVTVAVAATEEASAQGQRIGAATAPAGVAPALGPARP